LKPSKFWQGVAAAGIVALITFVAPAQAEERDGELTLLRGAAADGDSAAQFTLANHYYRGLGVQQDFEKALALYAQAADQGLAAAENRLGIMYEPRTGCASVLRPRQAFPCKAALHRNGMGGGRKTEAQPVRASYMIPKRFSAAARPF